MTPSQGTKLYWALAICGLAAAAGIVYFMATQHPELDECRERGEKYFREMGSWPRLSDGRDAETVVDDRCHRQPRTAFPQ